MAGPTKKSRLPAKAEDSDDESTGDESESGTYRGQQEIQATFEGRNPEEQDFHGIKQLLHQLFLKAHIDISQMTDLIIGQRGVGSVLKQGLPEDYEDFDDMMDFSDEDVFGVTSVIDLTSHKETPCIQQFRSLLEELSSKHSDAATKEKIRKLLNEAKLAFFINERFVNIPAKISSFMLNVSYDEIEKKKKREPSYNFDHYIMISKTCRSKENKDYEEFSNQEEEIFAKEADISFDFSVADESDTGLCGTWLSEDKQVIPYRRILIFKAEKLKNIVEQVTDLVQSNE